MTEKIAICATLVIILAGCGSDFTITRRAGQKYYSAKRLSAINGIEIRVRKPNRVGPDKYGEPIELRLTFRNLRSQKVSLLIGDHMFKLYSVPAYLHGPWLRLKPSQPSHVTLAPGEEYQKIILFDDYVSVFGSTVERPVARLLVSYTNSLAQMDSLKYEYGYVVSDTLEFRFE